MPDQQIFVILFVKVTDLFEYVNITGKFTGKHSEFMLKGAKPVE